jgi:hypothetical protein
VNAVLLRRISALREPRRATRLAYALWIVWAFLVWHVVFDHVLVVAGRQYLHAAAVAAHTTGSYARVDDWMGPAIARGLWTASGAAGSILVVGLLAVRLAARMP